jgi:hypothetical protein
VLEMDFLPQPAPESGLVEAVLLAETKSVECDLRAVLRTGQLISVQFVGIGFVAAELGFGPSPEYQCSASVRLAGLETAPAVGAGAVAGVALEFDIEAVEAVAVLGTGSAKAGSVGIAPLVVLHLVPVPHTDYQN